MLKPLGGIIDEYIKPKNVIVLHIAPKEIEPVLTEAEKYYSSALTIFIESLEKKQFY